MVELLKREVLRPLATLVVPGATILAPVAMYLAIRFPAFLSFVQSNAGASLLAAILSSLAAGLVAEDIGARIEVLWDSIIRRRDAEHDVAWDDYLALTPEREPVGQTYLRTILLRMKFELGMVVAIPISWAGFVVVQLSSAIWTPREFLLATFLAFALFVYLLIESFESAQTLGQTRRIIIRAVMRREEKPLKPTPLDLTRASGWRRLGVIASVLWLLAGVVAIIADRQFAPAVQVFWNPEAGAGSGLSPDWAAVLSWLFLPPFVVFAGGHLSVWISIRVVKWIQEGFRRA